MWPIDKLLRKCDQLRAEVLFYGNGIEILSQETFYSILNDMERLISKIKKDSEDPLKWI